MLKSLREETEGKLQMLLSPRKNGLTSLFKEVRVFKDTTAAPNKRFTLNLCLVISLNWYRIPEPLMPGKFLQFSRKIAQNPPSPIPGWAPKARKTQNKILNGHFLAVFIVFCVFSLSIFFLGGAQADMEDFVIFCFFFCSYFQF